MRIFSIIWIFIFLAGCNGGTTVKIDPDTCYLPNFIGNEDRDKIIDFTLGLSSALKGAPDLSAKIGDKTKIAYPDISNVNRILALSYAACVACRVNPGNVSLCGESFNTVLKQTKVPLESGEENINDIVEYKQRLLDPLLTPSAQ